MTTKNKVKAETLEEKIKEANKTKLTNKRGKQEFIWFWDDQSKVYKKLITVMQVRFGINGDGKVLTLACNYLLGDIKAEFGQLLPPEEEKDGEEI